MSKAIFSLGDMHISRGVGAGSSCWVSLGSDTSRLVFLVYPEECQGSTAPCVGPPVADTGQRISQVPFNEGITNKTAAFN